MKNQFKGRHFTGEVILFCLRWYLQSPLSYQQVADLVTECGFAVNKSTVWRWVQHYAPKLRYKLTKYLKSSTTGFNNRVLCIKLLLYTKDYYYNLLLNFFY